MMTHIRPHTLAPGGLLLLLGLGLLLPPALVPAEAGAQEDRDAICQGYRGTALWGRCTGAVAAGCAEAASPQCDRLKAAWDRQTGATPPWLLQCGFSSKCVFVTSATYTGNLGGLAGADAKCQALATAEGSLAAPGTYKAWLSDSTASPSTRFTKADVPYRQVDGSQIAEDWDDLTDGELETGIELDETGDSDPFSPVWTGTAADGAHVSDEPSAYCGNWQAANHPDPENIGITSRTDANWTDHGRGDRHGATCDSLWYLYCFQQ